LTDRRDCLHGGRHKHGTPAAYNQDRCRCGECRAAVRDYARNRYRRHAMAKHGAAAPFLVDSTGTRRRLQALAVLGWHGHEIGGRLDCSPQAVAALRGAGGMCLASTAEKVAAVYDELSMTVPPAAPYRQRLIHRALKQGWAPPLAWDDGAIDDPAAKPQHQLRSSHPGRPRDEDRAAEVARLTSAGLGSAAIAERVGVSQRTVARDRARRPAA
jgi:DNA-binding CsgD family transcriptional regulator